MKRANIKDVAQKAGVCASTVSNYLNKTAPVSKDTAKKIENAINEFDYRTDLVARSLKKQSSNSLGLIIRNIDNPYYSRIIRGIEKYILKEKLNYKIIISNINKDDINDYYIDSLLGRRVDGIITTYENISPGYLKYIKKINLPLVFTSCYKRDYEHDINYVVVDDIKGAYMMTEYLIKSGHEKIAFISTKFRTSSHEDRIIGYRKALKDYGLDLKEDIILCTDDNIEMGNESARVIFSKKEKPTAIFCVSDFTALGVLDYCYNNNLRVPDDVSVAGFDDNFLSSLSFINLTTIRDPAEKIGSEAVRILFDRIMGRVKRNIKKVIEPELIIRGSIKSIN